MKWVGDLSRADAALLAAYAAQIPRVLEFGVGGSTLIIAQSMPVGGRVLALDTSRDWLDRVAAMLGRLGCRERAVLFPYHLWDRLGPWDLAFVDGEPQLRLDFLHAAWAALAPGGHLLVHDTRRAPDAALVADLVRVHFATVDMLVVNQGGSNITVARKTAPRAYANWQEEEGLPAWRYGQGDVPESFWDDSASPPA